MTQHPSAAGPDAPSVARICPVCRTAVADPRVECPDCRAAHHQDCWDYNGGCGNYGCAAAPVPEKLEDLEIPAGYWGQDEKECPACHVRIQAAALRCRHCGTVFATARPQGIGEFHARRALEGDLPALQHATVWLLVFSLLPCTAPLAAVVGGIWYASRRERLAALPRQNVAIAKIALAVAVCQTVLLTAVGVLHGLLTR